jgi:glutamine synthetase
MTFEEVLSEIKEKEVKYVDVRFTDMRGRCSMSPSTSTLSTRTS